MAGNNSSRQTLVDKIFPSGIPKLWCPLLTHYTNDRGLDGERIAAHIRSIRPWVSAFLAPGSTGDGWELSSKATDSLLDLLLAEAGLLSFGNPFSNANRAMDHCLAWGAAYASAALPMTCSGNRLPLSLVETAARLMDEYGFRTTKGYLE